MKQYYGNYLGICINNQDPERRGRVQVFVPHIMPTLYDGWNKDGNDISISCVGDNLPEGLSSEIVERLTQILPWAESASPIIGTSAPGNLISGAVDAVGNFISGAAAAVGSFFSQTPTTDIPATDTPSQPPPEITGSLKFNARSTSDGKPTMPGGEGGNWAGSIYKVSSYLPKSFSTSSQKRFTPGGAGSDHKWANANAYAVDLGINTDFGGSAQKADETAIQIVNNIRAELGQGPVSSWSQYAGKVNIFTMPDGYQVKLIWQAANHYDHIHLGAQWPKNAKPRISESAKPGVVPATAFPDGGLTSTTSETSTQQTATNTSEQGDEPTSLVTSDNIKMGLGGAQTAPIAASPPSSNVVAEGSTTGPHKGKTIVSATGTNGSGMTTVTYSDGTTSTLNLPRPIRNNNPGNLEYGPFAKKMGAVGSDGRYAVFPTVEAGASAKVSLLKTSTYQNLSLRDAFNRYAPPGENPNYINDLQSGTGFDLNRKMSSLSPEEFDRLTATVAKIEGFNGPLPSGSEATASYTNPPSVVNKTYGHGPVAVKNTNDMPAGLFAYPSPGSMLWVFFREGNPLFPVYFAASYSQSEWAGAYRQGSEAPGIAYPGEGPGGGHSHSTIIHPIKGGGGLEISSTENLEDPSKDQKNVMLYADDGSNVLLATGLNQYFSQHDRLDHVEEDRFEITMGYKEEWVQGDSNLVVMGDCLVKVGDCSKQAVDALKKLAEHSRKMNQMLVKKS